MAGLIMCMLKKKPESRPAGAGTVHTVLMRHATPLGDLVNDVNSPARMYVVAAAVPADDHSAVILPDEPRPSVSAPPVPTGDVSRGDLHRAIDRARRLADESRYHPAIRHLKTVVSEAIPVLGPRDADVVDARIELAGLRFDSEDWGEAGDLYRALIDDLTAERGPYDDQVMYCQRRLAECILHMGRRDEAVDRLTRLQGQMDARYGGADRRVRELAELIENIRR
ncbi:tetratricopeptide repeat protein [Nocardia grenadensis]|uniref:tetratricopeptide repeat protein n=1 Tax=Nocardia grenadensis TaxID=931537 RepID=UPI0007A4B8B4|nr:tetratricopeptide repeat protein [Nocardia grenadensis]